MPALSCDVSHRSLSELQYEASIAVQLQQRTCGRHVMTVDVFACHLPSASCRGVEKLFSPEGQGVDQLVAAAEAAGGGLRLEVLDFKVGAFG